MSDPKDFLTRWSRRKRQAAEDPVTPTDEDQQLIRDEAPTKLTEDRAVLPPTEVAKAETSEPVFDLSKLPSIDSITAETDIRAFLAPGVPTELRLAALRRAWVADPKVRDFVGLNDYDFDFHTPGAIPGFGSLEMTDELRREVVRIVSAIQPECGEFGQAVTKEPDTATPDASTPQTSGTIAEINTGSGADSDAPTDQSVPHQDEVIVDKEKAQPIEDHAAPQQELRHPENLQRLARRGHGRALPK